MFWPINELYGTSSDSGIAVDMVKKGVSYYSPLSDNEKDVIKGSTNNGFSGKYATSVTADLGSGYKDHVVELRAYGSQYYTMVGNRQLSGAFAVKVFSLDTEGNRTEVASLAPTVNESQIQASNYSDELAYLRAGYLQEYDAYFEVAAADVDGDGVDEVFCYAGCYKDENGERLACVDMWDLQSDGSWSHTQEWVNCGQASYYVTEHELAEIRNSKNDPTDRMQLMMAPVVTLAGGDLDRRGGEELAITVSAPTNHDNPTDAARCYIYTWDDTAKRLSVVVNDGLGSDYIPLSTTIGAVSAMVSANCTFGTFSEPSGRATPTRPRPSSLPAGTAVAAPTRNTPTSATATCTMTRPRTISSSPTTTARLLARMPHTSPRPPARTRARTADTGRPWRPSPWVPHAWTASIRVPPRTTTSSWVGTSTRSVSPLG